LGSAVTRRHLEQGKPVRALSRTPAKLTGLKAMGAEVVQGDLRDPDSLRRACRDVTHVVASAHSFLGRGGERSALVDDKGHRDLIDAAQAAGVAHFIYVSVYGASPDHPAAFIRYKYGVEQYLKASGLPFTIVRPTAFLETHAYEFIGKTVLEQGKASLFGQGTGRLNFVSVEDVAQFILQVWDDPRVAGQTLDIGGPASNNLTNNEVVAMFERFSGQKAKVSHVPRLVLRVMSPLLRPFHPGLSQVMAFALYNDTHDTSFDAAPLLRQYPMELTRLEDWIEKNCSAVISDQAKVQPVGP
jgi:NADH dehydrogenase